jgi:hypothetical protein
MTDRERKKKKAEYARAYYAKKKQVNHGADEVEKILRDHATKTRTLSSIVEKSYDPALTIHFKGWKLHGIGPLSDLEKILTQLVGSK